MAVEFSVQPKPEIKFELDNVRVVQTGGGMQYEIGAGLKVEGNTLMVDTADTVEKDNTKPVTSAAVFVEVGNINALLATI